MQLWLLEAAQDDTPTMVIQIEEIKSFLAQVARSISKGPSPLTHDRADRNTQIHVAKVYAAECVNKNAR